MENPLLAIQQLLSVELVEFDRYFAQSLLSDDETLRQAVTHFTSKQGKRFRPLLTLLAAQALGKKANRNTMLAAVALELLHSASLIHDDVVDSSPLRRGNPTINALFDNRIAVLVGDFFLTSALQTLVETQSIAILNEANQFARRSTVGEINQLRSAAENRFSEENYFRIIGDKTASLFIAAVRSGAISVDATPQEIELLTNFATDLGLIFQMRDDLFDYLSETNEIGKPRGLDLQEGKVTLPLLYALNNCDKNSQKEALTLLSKKHLTAEETEQLVNLSIRHKGVEYTMQTMQTHAQRAEKTLLLLPDNPYRQALRTILSYTIDRKG